ncbi:MAG: filamentous hemagglutinin N-terminal domain-containing protein [Cyanobacteria bacterium P01_D01_bin.156]
MLPVALLAVTIPENAPSAALPPVAVPAASAQPRFSNGAQPDVLVAQAITPAEASTVVTSTGHQIEITGGQTSGDGGNLFHSFEQFGLTEQQTANFVANPQVQNILGRVQGGNASYIDGILQVSNSDANLFLLNPSGILFGENARLDLNGSFTATTADRVGFGDSWWDSVGTSDYGLLTGDPNQFSFSALQAGSVVNLGELAVDQHQSLTLLAGNVVNTGSVSAPGGWVTLASVNGQQVVTLGAADGVLTMELIPLAPEQGLSALSLPELLTGGAINESSELAIAPDGTVSLQGVTLPNGAGTTAVAGNLDVGGQSGGEINVIGDRTALLNANLDASGIDQGGTIRVGGGYQGNDAIPNAQITYIDAGSNLDVSSADTGDGGLAVAWADGLTSFYGSVSARGGDQLGDGGFVEISGKDQLIFRGNVDTNATAGEMGTLLLDPLNIVIAAGTGDGDGDSSNMTFEGDVSGLLGQILETDFPGATVTLFESELEGLSGDTNVILQASNNITLDDLPDNELTFQAGDSTIEFDAGNEFIMDGSDTIATNGRNLIIDANTLTLGNLFTDGGDIELTDNILLPANATFNTGVGQPGDINIGFGGFSNSIDGSLGLVSLELIAGDGNINLDSAVGNNFMLSSLTLQGNAIDFFRSINTTMGIVITAQDLPSFANLFGQIDTGGDISIASQNDIRSRNATITAGGSISITTPEDITVESGSWMATNDIELLADGTTFVNDSLDDALTMSAGNELVLQGTELLRVQANNNPGSELRTIVGDLTLRSDGVIVADATFNAGNDFLALDLTDNPGDLSGTSTDTLISSTGDISFGDYIGLALKVETQGSISGGDITIVGPNPTLAGADPDIPQLNSSSALILRAGNALQNASNEPGESVGGTTFTSSAATIGNISVGDIDTRVVQGEGGPVILSATGQITTGDINTSTAQVDVDDFAPPFTRGGDVSINAAESVTVQSVMSDGGEIDIRGSEIQTGRLQGYNPDTNLSDEATEGKVSLISTQGDIEVGSIRAGVGGVDINAAERFRAVGETDSFFLGTIGGVEEGTIPIKDSPEVIDYLVSQGFDRAELEISEATVLVINDQEVPTSIIAYSGDGETSNIAIRHGGMDLPDSEDVVIDGGAGDYEFAIGPTINSGLEDNDNNLAGFDPLDATAAITLYRSGDFTVYETIPSAISGTVGAIVVGNDINNGQVYSTFLNRPLPPNIEPDPPVIVSPEVDNPVTGDSLGETETLVADNDPEVDTDAICQPATSSLIASRSEDGSGECAAPATNDILQIEDDINAVPEQP